MSTPDIADGIRPSDRDREKILTLLSAAYGDGRLTKDEHEVRVNWVHGAGTTLELQRVVTDLPPAPVSRAEVRKASLTAWRQRQLNHAQRSADRVSWVRWQWGVVGMLSLGAAGLFAMTGGTVLFSQAKLVMPHLARDAGMAASLVLGFLLIVIAICSGCWLYDISEEKTGHRTKRGGSKR